jgi:hypothetical protein
MNLSQVPVAKADQIIAVLPQQDFGSGPITLSGSVFEVLPEAVLTAFVHCSQCLIPQTRG